MAAFAAPSQQQLAAQLPRPGRRRVVSCLACGIARANSAGVAVLAVRLAACVRDRQRVVSATLLTGLCAVCIGEAIRDGRITDSQRLRAMIGG